MKIKNFMVAEISLKDMLEEIRYAGGGLNDSDKLKEKERVITKYLHKLI